MTRRRRRTWALPALLVLPTAACGSGVGVDVPDLDPADQAACERVLDALPERLDDLGDAGLAGVATDPPDAPAAAWGDPAVVLTCGVGEPEEYDPFQLCQEIDGIGWFVPDSDLSDEPTSVTLTAVGYRPRVEIVVPAAYWPMGTSSAAVAAAPAVRAGTELTEPCR